MLLEEWMRRRDGVAHSSEIYAAGFTKRSVERAVQSGRMLRFRRSWIVLTDCDELLTTAVRAGGRLTCVSATARLGLWVPSHDQVHLAVPRTASRPPSDSLRLHWSTGPAPAHPRAVADPLINVLFHVARCLPPGDALAVWESAINRSLISPGVLTRIRWRSDRARRLAHLASGLSDSGLETTFIEILRALGVPFRQQVWIDGHPVDVLIGDRLVIQLDGFAHHADVIARRRDIEADARLRLRGYTVLRFDYHQVFFQAARVTDIVRTAVAQGLHLIA